MQDSKNNLKPDDGFYESRCYVLLGVAVIAAFAGPGFSENANATMDHHHMYAVSADRQQGIDASPGCVKAGQARVQH